MRVGYIFAFGLFIAGAIWTVLVTYLLVSTGSLGWNIPTVVLGFISVIMFSNSALCYFTERNGVNKATW